MWLRIAATLVRRLPRGRFIAAQWLARRPPSPFVARMPRRLGRYPFVCDLRDTISRSVYLTGSYEPQETAIVLALLRPGETFIDVGANWGYFALIGAWRVGPTGTVLAVEPDPRMYAALETNIRLAALRHVRALPFAATHSAGRGVLRGFRESDGNFGVSRLEAGARPPQASGLTVEVETKPLDQLVAEHEGAEIALLKMDIEGAEGDALLGLQDTLAARRVQRLLIELHPAQLREYPHSPASIADLLLRHGYDGWHVDHSPAVERRAHYARAGNPMHWLHPYDPDAELDAWPHQLWVRRGLSPLDVG